MTQLRINTPQDFFAAAAPWAFGLLIGLLVPADGLGKVTAGVIAWIIVQAIRYFWILRTLPEEPKPVFGLSPLYTAAGQKEFSDQQIAIKQQIAQLTSQSSRCAADMAQLDVTTAEGQEHLKQLSLKKAEIDQALERLKPSVGEIGFTVDRWSLRRGGR